MAVRMVKVTPVITAGGYTNGDSIGGVISIPDAPIAGTIQSILIQDDGDQGSALQLFFFESEPAGVADNAALGTISDEDMRLCVGFIAEDIWIDNATSQIAFDHNVSMAYEHTGGGLWMMIRLNDASTPTYVDTDDLLIRLGIVY